MKVIYKIILMGVLTLSVGLCQQVSSYTMAKLDNTANVKISSSNEALIAMPEEIRLNIDKQVIISRTKTDGMEGESVNETSSEVCSLKAHNFNITNNMKEEIKVYIKLGKTSQNSGITIPNNSKIGFLIPSSESLNVPMEVINNNVISGTIEASIFATWSEGSAEISKDIIIEVDCNTEVRVVDKRSKNVEKNEEKQGEKPKEEEQNKNNNNKQNNNSSNNLRNDNTTKIEEKNESIDEITKIEERI